MLAKKKKSPHAETRCPSGTGERLAHRSALGKHADDAPRLGCFQDVDRLHADPYAGGLKTNANNGLNMEGDPKDFDINQSNLLFLSIFCDFFSSTKKPAT